jgi:hypothetical protein
MTLYEITGELLALQNMIEEEDPDIVKATMESVEFDLEEKAEGYVKVIKNLEAHAAALRDEEKRLREKRQVTENGIERLKKRLYDTMTVTGKKKIDAGIFRLSIQKNGGALPVVLDVDAEHLPEDMVRLEIKPDTKKIAELLKGDDAEKYKQYAHFGERGESLRIR